MAPQQTPQQQQDQDQQLAAEVALVLATAVTVTAALTALGMIFAAAGISRQALGGALQAVMSFPPDRLGASGSATHTMIRLNWVRRAQFVVTSARRIQADLTTARSRNESLMKVLQLAIARERRYYGQHLYASWNRASAAARVDSAAGLYGTLLGWYTVRDSKTSKECLAADGKNFFSDRMPLIGYPGAVHPHCRCFPGRPHIGAMLLPSAGARRRVMIAA